MQDTLNHTLCEVLRSRHLVAVKIVDHLDRIVVLAVIRKYLEHGLMGTSDK